MATTRQRAIVFLRAEMAELIEQMKVINLLLSHLNEEQVIVVERETGQTVLGPHVPVMEPTKQTNRFGGQHSRHITDRQRLELRQEIIQLIGVRPRAARELADRTGVSRQTIRRYMNKLLNEGRAVQETVGSAHLFRLSPQEHHLDTRTNVVLD